MIRDIFPYCVYGEADVYKNFWLWL